MNKAALCIGAVAFIHRFGSSLYEHVHFHVCVVDGVFEVQAAEAGEAGEASARTTALSAIFTRPQHHSSRSGGLYRDHPALAHPARLCRSGPARRLRGSADAGVQAQRVFGRCHIPDDCIAAQDRAGLELLLPSSASPPRIKRLRSRTSLEAMRGVSTDCESKPAMKTAQAVGGKPVSRKDGYFPDPPAHHLWPYPQLRCSPGFTAWASGARPKMRSKRLANSGQTSGLTRRAGRTPPARAMICSAAMEAIFW